MAAMQKLKTQQAAGSPKDNGNGVLGGADAVMVCKENIASNRL